MKESDLTPKNLQKLDPVKKQATLDQSEFEQGLSPMSPPDSYSPPTDFKITKENSHPLIELLMKEHTALIEKLDVLKTSLKELNFTKKMNSEVFEGIKTFLDYFNLEFIEHNKKEEMDLFPMLDKKLMEIGEHSSGINKFTGIKILMDDHLYAIKLGAILENQLFLEQLIPDQTSKNAILNQLLKTGNELEELIRLHIFREDNIIFGQALSLLTREDLDQMFKALNS